MTMGLVLTIWLGVGAQIYSPPVKGHVPPPMTIEQCPYRNVSFAWNTTEFYAAATTTDSYEVHDRTTDMMSSSLPLRVEDRYTTLLIISATI
jgi:hypothetical protein